MCISDNFAANLILYISFSFKIVSNKNKKNPQVNQNIFDYYKGHTFLVYVHKTL